MSKSLEHERQVKVTRGQSGAQSMSRTITIQGAITATEKYIIPHTEQPVLSGHLKIDKTKVLKTDVSLMKVG